MPQTQRAVPVTSQGLLNYKLELDTQGWTEALFTTDDKRKLTLTEWLPNSLPLY